jgi:TRAP-type C4-dicarboxylate transport system substrate-binding protein
MFTNRLFRLLMIAVFILVVTACTPQAAATPIATSAPDHPITLHMGIPDGDNVLYAPYVLEFVNQANVLSNNSITIEPIWSAGNSTNAGYERSVIELVRESKLDLGLAASRAFDNDQDHITSFQALQAPFLIDNDALAVAVATSDTATMMLENLSSSRLAGLTL